MNKGKKHNFKIFVYSTIAAVAYHAVFYLVIKSILFQGYFSQMLADYLQDKLQTKVEIEMVGINPIDGVFITNFYLEDKQGDTLLAFDKLSVKPYQLLPEQNKFQFGAIIIQKLTGHISQDSILGNNFDFILDAFSSEPDTLKPESPTPELYFHDIRLIDSDLKYQYGQITDTTQQFDFNNMHLYGLFLQAQQLKIIGDSISGKIEYIGFQEKSGFHLSELSTSWMTISPTVIDLNKLVIQTPETNLASNFLILNTESWDSYNNFETDVKVNASFDDNSYLSIRDIGYFTSGVTLSEQIFISGQVVGYVNDLKGTNLLIGLTPETYLKSSFKITGLPKLSKSYLNLNIEDLNIIPKEISQIKNTVDGSSFIKLPNEISSLKQLNYKGSISGYLKNLLVNGKLKSDLGIINTDINIRTNQAKKYYMIEGLVDIPQLNAGKLVNDTANFKKLRLRNEFKLKYFASNKIEGEIKADIKAIDYNDYNYSGIQIRGDFTEKQFYGSLKISDPNLGLNFIGGFDLSKEIPTFSFTTNLENANLYQLNIDKPDSITNLSMMVNANFKGKKFNDLDGNLLVYLNSIHLQNKKMNNAQVNITATPLDNQRKKLTLNSDFMELAIEGKFDYETFAGSLEQFFYRFAPSLTDTLRSIPENDFRLIMNTKNITPFSYVFFPDYWIAPESTLDLNFSSANQKLSVNFFSPSIKFLNNEIGNLGIKAQNQQNKLSIDANAGMFIFGESGFLKNVLLANSLKNDTLSMNYQWNNENFSNNYSADILSQIIFSRKDNNLSPITTLTLFPSNTIIGDIPWYNQKAKIVIDTTSINIDNLTFKHNNQTISISGDISENKLDTIYLNFQNFQMSSLNPITEENGMVLSGLMNGQVKATNILNNMFVIVDDSIKKLEINEQEIGDLHFNSWLTDANTLKIDAVTNRGNIKTLDIKGNYKLDTDDINLKITLDKLYLSIAEPYLKGIISDIYSRSAATGDAKIFGKLSNPQYMINLKMSRVAFTVDYLQTRYNFTHNIFISNKLIKIKDMKINAGPNSYATLNGSIRHNNFENIKLNLGIDATNFHLLNTLQTDTSYFYGTAFATGKIKIGGTPDDLIVDISAKTNKNTRFFIPLSSSSEVSNSNAFITFEQPKIEVDEDFQVIEFGEIDSDNAQNETDYQVDLSGIQMNFDLEVTPEAEVQLIFDETVGDIIKAQGNGNLKLAINTNGEFNMYGTYFIEKGDYLFTLQNILNKHFFVQPGGSIRWTGDPYNAQLDLNAIYKIKRVTLFDLLQDPEYKEQKIPVECHLEMSKNLLSPGIDMSIAMPDADERIAAQVNNLNEDDKNKQILSLLILNRFQPLPGLTAISSDLVAENTNQNIVSSNATEVLSNQLSHWLSQISENIDIGVNYQLGNELTKDELEVALSTQLFNDRVSVNSNVGVGGGKVDATNTQTTNTTNASNIVGDVNVEVKLDKKGNVKLKAFAKANDKENLMDQQNLYEQGVGVFYRKDFTTFKALFKDIWNSITFKKKRKKTPTVLPPTNKDIERRED